MCEYVLRTGMREQIGKTKLIDVYFDHDCALERLVWGGDSMHLIHSEIFPNLMDWGPTFSGTLSVGCGLSRFFNHH